MNTTKRSKNNSQMWATKIVKMIDGKPDSIEIKYRYNAIRYLLIGNYPWIKDIPKEDMLSLLKDCVYLDRQMRLFNEGNEKELKKELTEEYLVELLK